MPDSLRPRGPIRLSVHGILQARILEWVAILQGIFPTQGSNPGLPHCQQTLTPEPPGKPTDAGGRLPLLRLDPVPSGFPGGWGKASAHHCRRLDGFLVGNLTRPCTTATEPGLWSPDAAATEACASESPATA